MSLYQNLAKLGPRFIGKAKIFKYGFNFSPMYKRSTAKITSVSDDLLNIKIKIPISYKNKNYVGSIFGGSMFSAVDPIPMVQLIIILDNKYIVWDKSAEIFFKIPAKENIYAKFMYSETEIDEIKRQVNKNGEMLITKDTKLTNFDETKIFCEVKKTMYIATKAHYKEKLRKRNEHNMQNT